MQDDADRPIFFNGRRIGAARVSEVVASPSSGNDSVATLEMKLDATMHAIRNVTRGQPIPETLWAMARELRRQIRAATGESVP